jgi:hypothetical protein
MPRVVMPLFDFVNTSERELAFGDGRYSLRRFRPDVDIPADVPGLSTMDLDYLRREQWALVAEDPDRTVYKEDINRLLLSFKIHTLGRLFIKYRLCVSDASLSSIVTQRMTHILAEKNPKTVSLAQLGQVNVGFERLQEMDAINGVSNRTHNAIFFGDVPSVVEFDGSSGSSHSYAASSVASSFEGSPRSARLSNGR